MSHGACQQREHLSQRNYRKAFHVNVVLIAAPRANLLGAVVRIRCPKNCTRTVKPIPQVRVRVSVCLFLSLSLSIPLFVSVAATLSLSRSLSLSSSVYLSFSLFSDDEKAENVFTDFACGASEPLHPHPLCWQNSTCHSCIPEVQ